MDEINNQGIPAEESKGFLEWDILDFKCPLAIRVQKVPEKYSEQNDSEPWQNRKIIKRWRGGGSKKNESWNVRCSVIKQDSSSNDC